VRGCVYDITSIVVLPMKRGDILGIFLVVFAQVCIGVLTLTVLDGHMVVGDVSRIRFQHHSLYTFTSRRTAEYVLLNSVILHTTSYTSQETSPRKRRAHRYLRIIEILLGE